ncbi:MULTISPECIES: hypothetical protein [unclassified Apibacter]|uniref:hypothetical protein n=1 Tax=unclassified Apibacter TaxID=2630820 RepID=UPI00132475BC|nr:MULTISPECIES: hypothetical protein [unclassified Apibacter]MCX8676330.1 hypothetical protein [Apibacter sp. B3919]MXO23795.1 hypothetical protein [Apibacter sp. B3924]MXO26527.1 hypothetical protein [Apibacter sp. B3813]MXO28479.1 hypothetical protein [Apibacter sp. B3913]MXO30433.1 hypothetical protein [Apibacter sp. B3912]
MNNVNKYKSTPFQTPENYFAQLENRIVSKSLINKTSKSPYKIPNNYFENLDKKIVSNTIEKINPDKPKIFTLFSKKIYWIPAAACLFITVMLGIYSTKIQYTTDSSITSANLENQNHLALTDNLYAPKPSDSFVSTSGLTTNIHKTTNNIPKSSPKRTPKKMVTNKDKMIEQEMISSSNVIYDLYFTNEETTNLYDEETSQDSFALF